MTYEVKDSGQRISYDSGMVRDVQDGKTNFSLLRDGPMHTRWAEHLTKGAEKYGKRNWQLANSKEEADRFMESAARHFEQWFAGETDEDHAAAVFFNINAAEYVVAKLNEQFAEAEEIKAMVEDFLYGLGCRGEGQILPTPVMPRLWNPS